ncbi:hypothetical protein RA224_12950 [Achromobacter aegrifaciens]|uniref:hypothetical protein n=1 Tax=Achromobacter aegrifaciens TaxID=1287736 RepID=UPI0027B9D902|nr:hypothetical protein [Achromobacter aegrifaciens]WLW64293.1 hypothetical protein RA224_12950 [Achromobacter aegrifaciens]
MQPTDNDAFGKRLAGVFEVYNRARPSAEAMAVWWRILQPFPLDAVSRALGTYTRTEPKFPPTPAQILELLGQGAGDSRLTADEAWPLALASQDEAETVVWTEEIAQAFAACRPVLDAGDDVGARMAFRAAYERLVAGARMEGRPAAWVVSLGFNAERRAVALERAVHLGQLSAPAIEHLLPAPADVTPDDQAAAENIARIKQMLASAMSPAEKRAQQREQLAAAERARLDKLKAQTAAKVEQQQNGAAA